MADDWEMIKLGVSQPKFLIAVFSASVNCKKSMPCKYFAMFFRFILKLQILKLELKNMALKTAS